VPNSKVDLYAAIRRDAKTGMSTRALMRKYGVGFNTVQRALTSALPSRARR
jgi:lambda repressor-like predicted transcriptional regulator